MNMVPIRRLKGEEGRVTHVDSGSSFKPIMGTSTGAPGQVL